MAIIGLSGNTHDAAAAIVSNDGDILFASHSERYSKNKNDPDLNNGLLMDAWRASGTEGVDAIAWYEKPLLKHTREIYSGEKKLFSKPFNPKHYLHQYCEGFFDKVKIKTFYHHESHAATAFQTSIFDSSIVVVVDAIGEWDCFSFWFAHYNSAGEAQYKKIHSIKYPHSLGLLYTAFTKYIGLKPNEEEYIMMGMAAYGNIHINEQDVQSMLVEPLEDDPIKFKYKALVNVHTGLPWDRSKSEASDEDIAASIQANTEDILMRAMIYVDYLCKQYKTMNICYGGGVALNCAANIHLAKQLHHRNIWIAPNPGDSGSALGAAALMYKKRLNFKNLYLGYNINRPYPIKQLLGELKRTGIAGVANGKAEFGPRALGNRSLLADPRGEHQKDKVNEIKHRQKFRPFSPVILPEYASLYFDVPENVNLKYMQYTLKAKPETIKKFPAIVHKDGTARVQIAQEHSGIYKLLTEYYFWTGGCPMLLNTSLNIRGEPIVNDQHDAQRFEQKYKVKVY